jgi:cell division protein FtsZ
LVNLDFADIRTVMAEMGKAMMGTGEADGDNRAIRAAEAAISNPLLEDTSMAGARGLLINITGGDDLTLFEVDQAANRIREEVDEEANIIFGSAIDPELQGRIRVSVVATGIDSPAQAANERPRLVAVGGGAMPAPTPIPLPMQAMAGAGVVAMHAGAISVQAPVMAAPPLRHAAPQLVAVGDAMSETAPMMEAMTAAEPQPIPHASVAGVQEYASQAAPQPGPRPVQPASRAGLFAEPPRPVSAGAPAQPATEPARPSLFSTVTGAFRRRQQAAGAHAEPAPVRAEPVMQEPRPEPPRASVRQTAGDEVAGLDIPAFLRRQSS